MLSAKSVVYLPGQHRNFDIEDRKTLIRKNEVDPTQVIKNCIGYCAFSKALRGCLLQRQAKDLVQHLTKFIPLI